MGGWFGNIRNFMMLHIIERTGFGFFLSPSHFWKGEKDVSMGERFAYTKPLLQVAYQHAQKRAWCLSRIVFTTALSSWMEVVECLIM